MYVNNEITKTAIAVKQSRLIFFILAALIQLLLSHNNNNANTPIASIMPPKRAFDELGGTPILLNNTVIPGITPNTPDAKERMSETLFKVI
jgi:hypothetical protein